MKFYQENKINPLASCLPLLLQLPVFISLFYMLRTDLKKRHLRPAAALYTRAAAPRDHHQQPIHHQRHVGPPSRASEIGCNAGGAALGQVPVHPRHHQQGDRASRWSC